MTRGLRQGRLYGADDFLILLGIRKVIWANGRSLFFLELEEEMIPAKFLDLFYPPISAPRQDDDGFTLSRIPHQVEAILLRRQRKPPVAEPMRSVWQEIDGQNGPGQNGPGHILVGPEFTEEALQLAFPPALAGRSNVWIWVEIKKGKIVWQQVQ